MLKGILPLLFLFLFFLMLLLGAGLSFWRMRVRRERFGAAHVFYLEEPYLLVNSLRCEIFFRIFVPLPIRFRLDSMAHVEIGYGHWRRTGYLPYIRIVRKNGKKSARYWVRVDVYDSEQRFFFTPVRSVAPVKQVMEKIGEELEGFSVPYQRNEKETESLFL